MNNESQEIAAQLRSIKKALFSGVGCLFVMATTTAISDVYYLIDDSRENKEAVMGRTFYARGAYLDAEGKWDALLALAKTRQNTHPMDPHAFWFEGIAHFRQERWDDAIAAFRKAAELNPSWKSDSEKWFDAAQKGKLRKMNQESR